MYDGIRNPLLLNYQQHHQSEWNIFNKVGMDPDRALKLPIPSVAKPNLFLPSLDSNWPSKKEKHQTAKPCVDSRDHDFL